MSFIHALAKFSRRAPDLLGGSDLQRWLYYLIAERKQAPSTVNIAINALLRQLHSQRWVVFAKGSVVGPEAVLEYLGRYTHRVAISNRRLLAIDAAARTVTFSHKDYADGHRIKPIELSGREFIRRLLLHVLPSGFTKIRHYGLLGNNRRKARLPLARAALEKSPLRFKPPAKAPVATPASRASLSCPHCEGQKFMTQSPLLFDPERAEKPLTFGCHLSHQLPRLGYFTYK